MKKLSKEQVAERNEHQNKVQEAWADLDKAVTAFNDAKREAWAKVEDAHTAYLEEVQAANEWRDGIATEASDYYGERSEKWQEGDAGSQYGAWVEALGNEFDEPDSLDEPDDLDAPEDVSDAIGEIPEDPGSA